MQRNFVSKSIILASAVLAVGYTNMSCKSSSKMSKHDISKAEYQAAVTPTNAQQENISTVSMGGTSGEELKRIMAEYVPNLNENLGDIAMVDIYEEGLVVTMNKGNFFDVNSYIIKEEAKEDLRKVAFSLNQMPNTFVVVGGHTDATGSYKHNKKLSRMRAVQVANYLKSSGVDEKRLLVEGYGKDIPRYSNNTMKGRDKNRRVDFVIVADNAVRESTINTMGSVR